MTFEEQKLRFIVCNDNAIAVRPPSSLLVSFFEFTPKGLAHFEGFYMGNYSSAKLICTSFEPTSTSTTS